MAEIMAVDASLAEGVSFAVTTESGHQIVLDNLPQPGKTSQGPCPVEMLLAGLAGCAGIGIIGLLRKMRQQVHTYTIHIQAERAEQHPRIFTRISVEHILTGTDLQPAVVERAISLNEERYCAVGIMLGHSIPITQTFRLHEVSANVTPTPSP